MGVSPTLQGFGHRGHRASPPSSPAAACPRTPAQRKTNPEAAKEGVAEGRGKEEEEEEEEAGPCSPSRVVGCPIGPQPPPSPPVCCHGQKHLAVLPAGGGEGAACQGRVSAAGDLCPPPGGYGALGGCCSLPVVWGLPAFSPAGGGSFHRGGGLLSQGSPLQEALHPWDTPSLPPQQPI